MCVCNGVLYMYLIIANPTKEDVGRCVYLENKLFVPVWSDTSRADAAVDYL